MNSNYNWSDNRVLGAGSSNPNNAPYRRTFPSPDMDDSPEMSSGGSSMTGMRGTSMAGTQGTTMMGTTSMMSEQGPPPATDRSYIPGYLAANLGKNVRAEFVLGTGFYTDKTGILREVGTNYFVLEDYISHARIMCDLYSVKFVTTL